MACKRKIIAINLKHGLCNRLRALASAKVLSESTHRWLRVISIRDMHFNADLGEMLNLTASNLFDVWNFFDDSEINAQTFVTYDYMRKNTTVQETLNLEIDVKNTKHIYISSAYVINHPLISYRTLQGALRSLVPTANVHGIMKLYERAVRPSTARFAQIGVHLRSLPPATELIGLSKAAYPTWGWEGLTEQRQISSNVTRYASELEKYADDSVVFVASDNPNSLAAFRSAMSNSSKRIVSIKSSCATVSARSRRCMEFAFADLLILAQSSVILGSGWSSFTDIAGRLAGVQPLIAGTHF